MKTITVAVALLMALSPACLASTAYARQSDDVPGHEIRCYGEECGDPVDFCTRFDPCGPAIDPCTIDWAVDRPCDGTLAACEEEYTGDCPCHHTRHSCSKDWIEDDRYEPEFEILDRF